MPSPLHYLLQQTAGVGGMGGLMNSAEFIASFRDLGAGAVDTALDRGVGPATFTRATAASAKLSTGLWNLAVAPGTARSHYLGANTSVGAYGGYLAEGARTNLCLQSRDLSNASWTKVNTTAAKDQVGIDGVTNSASSLTATAGGGTCLQTITEAATDSTLSLYLKRITGVGTITIQQGVSTADVTAQVNSVTYTQVVLDATVLNPIIGIVLGTNGDKIAVDCVQFENGSFASTPIPTTTVAVTRNADLMTYAFAGNESATVGSSYTELSTLWTSMTGANSIAIGGTTVTQGPLLVSNNASTIIAMNDGTTTLNKTGITDMSTGIRKRASSWSASGMSITGDGVATATNAFVGPMPSTALSIGCATDGTRNWFGTIKAVRIWQRQLPDATLQVITT